MALADQVKHDTYMGTGPSPTGREIADIVKKYLPNAEITFDESARVGKMVLDEINGTREQAGLARVDAG